MLIVADDSRRDSGLRIFHVCSNDSSCGRHARFRRRLGAPDGHLFYTPTELYAQISTWGDAGRNHYISFRLGLDPVWALAYTSFLITITSVALRRATQPDDRRRLLNLTPLIPMSADLAENLMGIALMSAYPNKLEWLAWLTATTSCFKWVTLGLAHLLMLYALAISLRVAMRRKQATNG